MVVKAGTGIHETEATTVKLNRSSKRITLTPETDADRTALEHILNQVAGAGVATRRTDKLQWVEFRTTEITSTSPRKK